jgi:hypothetical protein
VGVVVEVSVDALERLAVLALEVVVGTRRLTALIEFHGQLFKKRVPCRDFLSEILVRQEHLVEGIA